MPFTLAGFNKLKEYAQQVADEEQVSFYLNVPGVGGEPITPRSPHEYVTVRKDYLDVMERMTDDLMTLVDRFGSDWCAGRDVPDSNEMQARAIEILRPVEAILRQQSDQPREPHPPLRRPELYTPKGDS